MDNDLKSYFEGMKGKKVFFLGAGKSNAQLITKYASFGSQVTLCDIREENELSSYIEAFGGLDISLNLGVNYLSNLSEADIIFRTPGIDYTKQEIQKAVLAGVVVTSEIEMFFRFCPCLTIGITGSDGKTTTSSLIAAILEKAGYMVWLGGNIGRPLFPLVEEMKKEDIAVVELSSFQLISMKQSPDISLITNITPNHLDHHKDMQEYIDAKRNILLYQNSNSVAVLNRDNSVTSLLASDVQGELRYFRRKPVEHGSYIRNNTLYFSSSAHLATSDNTEINGESSDIDEIMVLDNLKLLGEHNKDNIAAAYAVTHGLVENDVFIETVREFRGVEHRIEFVREVGGVKWFNDSIATSPTRTIAGLRSFDSKIILIAGGSDKGLSYYPLLDDLADSVKCAFLSGPTAQSIAEVIRESKAKIELFFTSNVESSVAAAYSYARPGDIVMLSPASPSFDSYSSFEERGRHFKALVNLLE